MKINKKVKTLGEWVGFGLILLAIFWWQQKDLLPTDGSHQIQPLTLPALQGEPVTLTPDARPTLIYFFAPWCSVCHVSIDNLTYLDPEKVRVITVAMDYSSVEAVAEFVSQHEFDAPVLLGTQDLKSTFNIGAYPTYYLLDPALNVISSNQGYSTAAGLKLRSVFSRVSP